MGAKPHGGEDPTALSHAALAILHLDYDFVTASNAIERAGTQQFLDRSVTGALIHA
jgi:hypothetical protein